MGDWTKKNIEVEFVKGQVSDAESAPILRGKSNFFTYPKM